jgi:hypothetical protein
MEPKGSLQSLGDAMASRVRNIEINSADPIARHGFTQVPNFILRNPELSIGAKTTYALLLSYAWHNDYCFPGQERLAIDAGMGKSSVNRFILELQELGLIDIERRGLGKTNFYTINFVIKPLAQRKKRNS